MIGAVVDAVIGPLGVALTALAAIIAAFFTGRRQAAQRARLEQRMRDATSYRDTAKAVGDVEVDEDHGALRDWLRERGRKP